MAHHACHRCVKQVIAKPDHGSTAAMHCSLFVKDSESLLYMATATTSAPARSPAHSSPAPTNMGAHLWRHKQLREQLILERRAAAGVVPQQGAPGDGGHCSGLPCRHKRRANTMAVRVQGFLNLCVSFMSSLCRVQVICVCVVDVTFVRRSCDKHICPAGSHAGS